MTGVIRAGRDVWLAFLEGALLVGTTVVLWVLVFGYADRFDGVTVALMALCAAGWTTFFAWVAYLMVKGALTSLRGQNLDQRGAPTGDR